MMSRKDYIETSKILNKYKDFINQADFESMVDDFSYWFESDNPNFDSARFFQACNKELVR